MSSGSKEGDGYKYEYVPAAMCYSEKATTQFADLNMDQMKAMVINAKPGEVHNVARGWGKVNDDLVGEGGGGGSRHDFLTAVNGVLEHWEGDAADRFKAQAEVIAQKMQDGAKYAEYTSVALGSAATVLETIKPEVDAMERPGMMSSAGDFLAEGFSHDDSGYRADKRAGMSTQEALSKNKDGLSAGKEAQLKMAVKMEQLGAAYASQTKAMGSWQMASPQHDKDKYPGDPGGTVPVPIVAIPTESGPKLVGRTPSSSGSSSSPGRSAITTSPSSPDRVGSAGTSSSSKVSAPSGVGTDVDGLAVTSPRGTASGVSGGSVSGGYGPGGGVGSGGVSSGSGAGVGFPGTSGGAAAGLGRGGAASGVGSAKGAGRAGMGGAGAGMGARAKGRSAAGGRGPLARTKGGLIGEAEGRAASETRAGSGLHGSRGGTEEGRKAAGLGGAGGAAGKGRDKKKNGSDRPDYLVEDEETWVPERGPTNPRTIE
jgi:hypothetical protein